jgi:DNA invertase Pin-like site-specific DNA recombinase
MKTAEKGLPQVRAAIYARYSTDLQSETSIDDQVRLCRKRIDDEGWQLVEVFADKAASGASSLRRGYQRMQEAVQLHKFDVIVAEALDRVSRDMEDVSGLYKRLTFAGVKLLTLAEGEISDLHVGLKGTMNALFLKDLAAKTHRGLRGRVEQGRSGGGLCYGYEVVREADTRGERIRGGRRIHEADARVVRRIFETYAAGASPRAIAKKLNAEHVPGPRGQSWNDSTIHGNRQRGTGVLNNDLYVGRIVWNRQHFIKDPASGKRVARPNPPDEWVVIDVPALRIIEQELWAAVKHRQAELELPERGARIRNTLNTRHRTRHLLSGLLTCGTCGSSYTLAGAERYACAGRINRGTCSNPRTVRREAIERRVLAGLKEKLLAPELVAEFVREFHAEANRLAREGEAARGAVDRQLADTDRRIGQIVGAIEQGIVTASTKSRLIELETQREQLAGKLAALAHGHPPVPRIHPNAAEIYRRRVADLEAALNDPEDKDRASAVIRSLIERIVLYPADKRGEVRAE